MGIDRAIITDEDAGTPRQWVRWNAGMRARFLDHLAATCNVKASAQAIGVDPCSVYILRRRNAAFADEWGEALALGYEMLETQLVGHALAGRGECEAIEEVNPTLPRINVDLAIRLLGYHRSAQHKPQRGGPKPKIASADETDKAIVAKLAKIAARRRKAAEEAAAEQVATGGAGPTEPTA